MEILIAAMAVLAVSNVILAFWVYHLKHRDEKTDALRRAIAAFEVEGQTILSIQKINPDNVYLRNPMGH